MVRYLLRKHKAMPIAADMKLIGCIYWTWVGSSKRRRVLNKRQVDE